MLFILHYVTFATGILDRDREQKIRALRTHTGGEHDEIDPKTSDADCRVPFLWRGYVLNKV